MTAEVTRLEASLPAKLVAEMQALVDAGWFRDRDEILTEALRRYLESHRPRLLARPRAKALIEGDLETP